MNMFLLQLTLVVLVSSVLSSSGNNIINYNNGKRPFFVDCAPTFNIQRVGEASGIIGENRFSATVIDTTNQRLYAGTYTVPSKVVQFDISANPPVRLAVANAVGQEYYFVASVIHAPSQIAIFGAQLFGTTAKIVKFNLVTMTRIASVAGNSDERQCDSMIADFDNNVLYVSLATPDPRKILKIDISGAMTNLNRAVCPASDSYLGFPVMKKADNYGVWCTVNSPMRILKYNLNTNPVSRISSINAAPGEDQCRCGIIHESADLGWFCTASTSPGKIVKFDLSGTTARLGSLGTDTGEYGRGLIDTRDSTMILGYFTSGNQPFELVVFDLSTDTRLSSGTSSASDKAWRAAIDLQKSFIMITDDKSPGKVLRFNLGYNYVSSKTVSHSKSKTGKTLSLLDSDSKTASISNSRAESKSYSLPDSVSLSLSLTNSTMKSESDTPSIPDSHSPSIDTSSPTNTDVLSSSPTSSVQTNTATSSNELSLSDQRSLSHLTATETVSDSSTIPQTPSDVSTSETESSFAETPSRTSSLSNTMTTVPKSRSPSPTLMNFSDNFAANNEPKRVALDPEVIDAVDGMITMGQALKVVTGTTQGSLVMGRTMILLAGLSCGTRLEPLPLAVNPTRMTIGDDSNIYRWWLGVVVGDGVAVVGFAVVGSVFLLVLKFVSSPTSLVSTSRRNSTTIGIVEVIHVDDVDESDASDASDASDDSDGDETEKTNKSNREARRLVIAKERVIEKIATLWFICSSFLICGCVATLIYVFLPYGAPVNLPFGSFVSLVPTIVPLWVFYNTSKLMQVVPMQKIDADEEEAQSRNFFTRIMTWLFGNFKSVEWVPKSLVAKNTSDKNKNSNQEVGTSLEEIFNANQSDTSIILNDDTWREMTAEPPQRRNSSNIAASTSNSPIHSSLEPPPQTTNNNDSDSNHNFNIQQQQQNRNGEEFSRRWGFLYEHTDSLVFAYMDIICNFLISFSGGLMQNPDASESFCQINAIFTLIAHVPPTIFVIWKRPLLSRFDFVVTCLLWVGSFVISLLVLLSYSGVSDLQEALDSCSILLGCLALISGSSDVARLIFYWIQKRTLRKIKKFGKNQSKNQTQDFVVDWSGLAAQAQTSMTSSDGAIARNKDFLIDDLMKFLEAPTAASAQHQAEDEIELEEEEEEQQQQQQQQQQRHQEQAGDSKKDGLDKVLAAFLENNTYDLDDELEESENDCDRTKDNGDDDRGALGAARNEELERRRREMESYLSHS